MCERLACGCLLALLAFLYLYRMDEFELAKVDESRSGVIVRSMVEDGQWLLPRTPDGFYTEKPIVYYGLCALLARFVGLGEVTLRGVSALMAIASMGAVWWLTRIYGSPRAACIAATAFAANVLIMRGGRSGTVDMTLTCFVTLGLTAYLAARAGQLGAWPASLLCGLCFGLATLSKGPVGAALPFAVCVSLELAERGARGLRAGPWLLAVGVCALLALLWYVPAYLRGGREFLETSLLSENLYMPLGTPRGLGVGHHKPSWFYPLNQVVALLPTALFVPATVAWLFRQEPGSGARPLATWFAAGFALFALAANKRAHYLMPLQPALSAAIGLAASRADLRGHPLLRASAIGFAGMLAAAGAAGILLALYPALLAGDASAAQQMIASGARVLLCCSLLVLLASGGLLVVALRRARAIPEAGVAIAALLLGVRVVGYDAVAGHLDRTRPFVRSMLARVPAGARPALLSASGYDLDFYWPTELLHGEASAERADWVFVQVARESELRGDFERVGVCHFPEPAEDVALLHRRRACPPSAHPGEPC